MITLELIEDFTNSYIGLRYKYHIKVIAYHLYGDYIHIMFRESGELVLLEEYYNWLKLKRDSKLEMIGL